MNLDLDPAMFQSLPGEASSATVRIAGADNQVELRKLDCLRSDGKLVFEGDIILRPVPALAKTLHYANSVFGNVVVNKDSRWPNGLVPYVCSPELEQIVMPAIAHWMAHTPIRFAPFKGERDCVSFEAGDRNASEVGRVGGIQAVWLRPDTSVGTAIHEIGHLLGLWHEHGRKDRDQYIVIHPENYSPGDACQFSQPVTNAADAGRYDYGSIMHYPADAFSINGKATITPKAGGQIGQRNGLSEGDIAAIRGLYPGLVWELSAFHRRYPPSLRQNMALAGSPEGKLPGPQAGHAYRPDQ